MLLRAAGGRAPSRLEEIAVGWTLSGRRAEWGVQPAAGGKESPDVPGGDVGDQLEGAADGREGGAGIHLGRVLVIQHRDLAAMPPQRLPAMV